MASKRRDTSIRFYVNGKRAEDAYGLSRRVGNVVKRVDAAKKKAVASTVRKVSPYVKQAIAPVYSIAPSKLTDRVRVQVTPDTIRISASASKFSLVEFQGKWGGRASAGATASIVVGRQKTYAGAFISPGRLRGSDTKLIYARTGQKKVQKYGRYKGKNRESIRALRGPSTAGMLSDTSHGEGVRPTVVRALVDFYINELKRQYALEKGT